MFIVDGGNHARGALEVENRFLKLGVVQVGEEMGGPGNRVGLAGARRMLNQVTTQDFQPAIALPNFFPQVIGGKAERISTPRRSTSRVPCSFRHLRTRSASTLVRLAPWVLVRACQLSGWAVSIQASRSGRNSAFCRS